LRLLCGWTHGFTRLLRPPLKLKVLLKDGRK
jgi:hypothetical protein